MPKQYAAILAVYGTLRRSMWNNILLEDSLYLCDAYVSGLSMYTFNGLVPFCVINKDTDNIGTLKLHKPIPVDRPSPFVKCELYAVDQTTLDGVDGLEGVEVGFYDRTYIRHVFGFPAYVYTRDVSIEALQSYEHIKSGDFVKYYFDKCGIPEERKE